MTCPPPPDVAPEDPVEAGWALVRLLLRYVLNLCGDAPFFASLQVLRPALRRATLVWLRPAEAMARRLLLIMAAEAPGENAPPPRRAMGRAFRAHGRSGFANADPARWAVSFRTAPAPRKPTLVRPGAPRPGAARLPRLTGGWGLAERIEALTRVAADPDKYARLLARRLARRPTLAARFVTPDPPWFAPSLFAAMSPAAKRAAARFESG